MNSAPVAIPQGKVWVEIEPESLLLVLRALKNAIDDLSDDIPTRDTIQLRVGTILLLQHMGSLATALENALDAENS